MRNRLTERDLSRIVRRVIKESTEDFEYTSTPFGILGSAEEGSIYPSYIVNKGNDNFVIWGSKDWNVTLRVTEGKFYGNDVYKSTVTIDVETNNKADYDFIKSKFNDVISNNTTTPMKDSKTYRVATSRDFGYKYMGVGLIYGNIKTKTTTEAFEELLNKVLSTLTT